MENVKNGAKKELLRQHRTIASADLSGSFAPLLQFQKREIHKEKSKQRQLFYYTAINKEKGRTNNPKENLQILSGNGKDLSLSKKSSLCWAFSVILDIMVVGDEECCKVEKWNEAYLKSWIPKAWYPTSICCAK